MAGRPAKADPTREYGAWAPSPNCRFQRDTPEQNNPQVRPGGQNLSYKFCRGGIPRCARDDPPSLATLLASFGGQAALPLRRGFGGQAREDRSHARVRRVGHPATACGPDRIGTGSKVRARARLRQGAQPRVAVPLSLQPKSYQITEHHMNRSKILIAAGAGQRAA